MSLVWGPPLEVSKDLRVYLSFFQDMGVQGCCVLAVVYGLAGFMVGTRISDVFLLTLQGSPQLAAARSSRQHAGGTDRYCRHRSHGKCCCHSICHSKNKSNSNSKSKSSRMSKHINTRNVNTLEIVRAALPRIVPVTVERQSPGHAVKTKHPHKTLLLS